MLNDRLRGPIAPNHTVKAKLLSDEEAAQTEKDFKEGDPDKALAAAQRLVSELSDQVQPWKGKKSAIAAAVATVASISASASSLYFAENLLGGPVFKNLLSEGLRGHLEIPIAGAAALPAFFLSWNSNLANWNRLLRSFPYMTPEDIKQNLLPVVLTVFSAVVSFKINWDAFKFAPIELRVALAAGRALSALSTNGLFAVKQQKNFRGNKDVPEVNAILDAGKKLKELAKSSPAEFIEMMDKSKLFERLMRINTTKTDNSKDDVNNIFLSLLHVLQDKKPEADEKAEPKTKPKKEGSGLCKKIIPYSLGPLSAVPYFFTAQSVVTGLFGLEGPLALWSLGSILGVSSVSVNAAIAAISIADFMDSLSNTQCPASCTEALKLGLVLPFKLYCLLGNAFAQAGMAYQLSIKDHLEGNESPWFQVLALAEATINFLVNLGIGNLSIESFFRSISSGYYVHCRKILETAKAKIDSGEAQSLLEHYNSLKPDNTTEGPSEDQLLLVRILEEYRAWAFDSLLNFFNSTDKKIVAEIFTAEVLDALYAHHRDRKQAQDAIIITVEPPPLAGTTSSTPVPIPPTSQSKLLRVTDPEIFTNRGELNAPTFVGSPALLAPSQTRASFTESVLRRRNTERQSQAADTNTGAQQTLSRSRQSINNP